MFLHLKQLDTIPLGLSAQLIDNLPTYLDRHAFLELRWVFRFEYRRHVKNELKQPTGERLFILGEQFQFFYLHRTIKKGIHIFNVPCPFISHGGDTQKSWWRQLQNITV